jgi:hypothetical protein
MSMIGAVITYKPETTTAQFESLIEKLRESGLVETVQWDRFNPEYGSPVFYVP